MATENVPNKEGQCQGQEDHANSLRYTADLEEIPARARELFEKYSGIPSERVHSHILELGATSPSKSGPTPASTSTTTSSSPRQTLLDLGCCFAQDLRKLIYDGVSPYPLHGFDMRLDFVDMGYDLFLDHDRWPEGHFKFGDIFAQEEDSALKKLDGKIDIVQASSFFHLFDYAKQLSVATRLVSLLRPVPGSPIVGRQVGNVPAGEFAHRTTERSVMWRHDKESWEEMWREVGMRTGTEWRVKASLSKRGELGMGSGRKGEGHLRKGDVRRLVFEVERL